LISVLVTIEKIFETLDEDRAQRHGTWQQVHLQTLSKTLFEQRLHFLEFVLQDSQYFPPIILFSPTSQIS